MKMRQQLWKMKRKGALPIWVQLCQYSDMEISKGIRCLFSPVQGFTCAPNLQRFAIVSCAENWFIDGKSVRLNPAETDEHHPGGMMVSDKLNVTLREGLTEAKMLA